MAMSIIDRAARALAEKYGGDFDALTPEMQETVRDEVRVVLRAALARQPIDTAPRDGTVALLFGGVPDWQCDEVRHVDLDSSCPYEDEASDSYIWEKARPVTGWFSAGIWRYCSYDSGVYGELIAPTEWMPLPEPPHEA